MIKNVINVKVMLTLSQSCWNSPVLYGLMNSLHKKKQMQKKMCKPIFG